MNRLRSPDLEPGEKEMPQTQQGLKNQGFTKENNFSKVEMKVCCVSRTEMFLDTVNSIVRRFGRN